MRESVVVPNYTPLVSSGVEIKVRPQVTNKAMVWLNVTAWSAHFQYSAYLTPDQADALADALREEAQKARKVRDELDANAAITAAGMVA